MTRVSTEVQLEKVSAFGSMMHEFDVIEIKKARVV